MNTEKFKQELINLIVKFNESQGTILLDIDLRDSVIMESSLGKKQISYDIKIKLG